MNSSSWQWLVHRKMSLKEQRTKIEFCFFLSAKHNCFPFADREWIEKTEQLRNWEQQINKEHKKNRKSKERTSLRDIQTIPYGTQTECNHKKNKVQCIHALHECTIRISKLFFFCFDSSLLAGVFRTECSNIGGILCSRNGKFVIRKRFLYAFNFKWNNEYGKSFCLNWLFRFPFFDYPMISSPWKSTQLLLSK